MSLDNCLKHMYMYNQKVISKVVTRLLRLTTLFNLFCVALIVDCDYILRAILMHQTRDNRRHHQTMYNNFLTDLSLFTRGGSRGGSKLPQALYSTHFRKSWDLINLCTNSIIKRNFCTSTWNNLYFVVGSTHHTPNLVIYMPMVSPMLLCVIQISWLALFLLFANKVIL